MKQESVGAPGAEVEELQRRLESVWLTDFNDDAELASAVEDVARDAIALADRLVRERPAVPAAVLEVCKDGSVVFDSPNGLPVGWYHVVPAPKDLHCVWPQQPFRDRAAGESDGCGGHHGVPATVTSSTALRAAEAARLTRDEVRAVLVDLRREIDAAFRQMHPNNKRGKLLARVQLNTLQRAIGEVLTRYRREYLARDAVSERPQETKPTVSTKEKS